MVCPRFGRAVPSEHDLSADTLVLLCQIRMPFVLSLSKDERIRPSGSRFDRLSTNGNAGIHESDKVGLATSAYGKNLVEAVAIRAIGLRPGCAQPLNTTVEVGGGGGLWCPARPRRARQSGAAIGRTGGRGMAH